VHLRRRLGLPRPIRGFIGTNKKCATGAVQALLADAAAGQLADPANDRRAVAELLRRRGFEVVDHDGWLRIDESERSAGEARAARA
jgi:ferredoxin--NADP+ reductase